MPTTSGGTFGVDLSTTEDSSSEEQSPAADPSAPAAAAAIASAVAERARASVLTASAGDITVVRQDVGRVEIMD